MSDGMRDSAHGVGRYLFGTKGKYPDEEIRYCEECETRHPFPKGQEECPVNAEEYNNE